MHVCMHVLYRSLFLVVCFLSVLYLINVFSFLLQSLFLPIGMSMLGSCPLWTSFEQVTWGIRFYPNKGSLGHLLQHENNSTGLNKRRLINLKPSGLLQIYLFFSGSIFLTTYRYMSIQSILCSYYPSISRSISISFVVFPFVYLFVLLSHALTFSSWFRIFSGICFC